MTFGPHSLKKVKILKQPDGGMIDKLVFGVGMGTHLRT